MKVCLMGILLQPIDWLQEWLIHAYIEKEDIITARNGTDGLVAG